jgi:hypothetical protein
MAVITALGHVCTSSWCEKEALESAVTISRSPRPTPNTLATASLLLIDIVVGQVVGQVGALPVQVLVFLTGALGAPKIDAVAAAPAAAAAAAE